MADTSPVNLKVENLFKIFGPDPQQGLEQRREGLNRAEIREKSGNLLAVDDVSFSVEAGRIFVVMGLSGSGKSTLIRCINRLIMPTAGRIEIAGESLLDLEEEGLRKLRLHKIAMVFQHFALLPHRTVGQNVEYGLKIQNVDSATRREKALTALEQVGLGGWAESPIAKLSGGMQQRVGLARALAVDPEILLMDEPFSALDPLIRRDMQDELIQLQRQMHKTIVFITHDLHEALKLGDEVAIMKDGRFVQIGAPADIVSRPADAYVEAFTQDVDRGRVFTLGDIMKEAPSFKLGSEGDLEDSLEKCDADFIHAVDEGRQPVGLVSRARAAAAKKDGEAVEDLVEGDSPRAEEDRELADAYSLCETGRPIAITDAKGRLVGSVHPLEIFAYLATDGGRAPKAAADGGKAPKSAAAK